MPRKRNKADNKAECTRLRQEIADLRTQKQDLNGFYYPPLPCANTRQWDWECSACRRLVYTLHNRCNCGLPYNTRTYGAIVSGSVRGRHQENSVARQAAVAQQRVPASNATRPSQATRVQRESGPFRAGRRARGATSHSSNPSTSYSRRRRRACSGSDGSDYKTENLRRSSRSCINKFRYCRWWSAEILGLGWAPNRSSSAGRRYVCDPAV